ncbi:MAG: MFS transporter, partial [Anaerolineales bacterium]|nr:MFS transporter [Anaerolineales bacterium]
MIRPRVYYALTQGAFGIYLPFIYVYLEQERQLNGRQIGILAAIAPLMTLLIAPVWASMADSSGSRLQTLRWAVAGAAASVLLIGLPNQFFSILILFVLYNFFQVAIIPLSDGILASAASRRKIPYGNLRLWGSFGFALTGIVFGQIGRRLGLNSLFSACALLFLLAVPVAWQMVQHEPPPPKRQAGSRRALIDDRAIIQFLVVAGLAAVGITAGYTFLYVFIGGLGASAGLIGAVSAVGALVEAPFMLWGGKLIRRHGAPT